jgi:hypothetical protein
MLIDESGAFIRHHEDGLHLPQAEPWRRLSHFARYRSLCNPQFGVIRTDVLRQTSLLTGQVSSDETMLAQLALRGQFHEVPERLFLRRLATRSPGVGGLSKQEIAQWFDPDALKPRISPKLRVWQDVQASIVRAPLPFQGRLRTLVAYDIARARREVGLVRYRRRLKRSGQAGATSDEPSAAATRD